MKLFLTFCFLFLVPNHAFAEVNSGDTAWILTSTALVLLMTLPGLALFYTGLVQSRNAVSVLMHHFAIACLASVLWVVICYSLAFSEGNEWIGGLSNIFLQKYKNLNLHRPLKKYSKKQIKSYANKNKLIWFEDRSNLELDYTRNKIRNFLYSNKLFSQINYERLDFSKISHLNRLHKNFFKRKRNKIFEIEDEKFNHLNDNLKFFAVQSFYYEYRHLLNKQIRDENIRNFIKKLKAHILTRKDMSVFSGKIGAFDEKICINLS